jgi:hypothetical protein
MFSYPADLVESLRAAWRKPALRLPLTSPLPGDALLARLLETCYHTSFLSEEGRRLAFRIMYLPQAEFDRRQRERRGSARSLRAIVFDVPRRFAVGEILRLAPATDMTQAIICVGPGDPPDDPDRLVIWGLLDSGGSWWNFIHGESDDGHPPPDCLSVSSSEPGNLAISRTGMVILNLRHGRLTQPVADVLFRGPVAQAFEGAARRMHAESLRSLSRPRFDPQGQDDEDYPQRKYLKHLERILFRAEEQGHGATILVVPEQASRDAAFLRDKLLIKYASQYDVAWNLLLKHIVLYGSYYDLFPRLYDGTTEFTKARFREIAALEQELEETDELLTDSVKFVAALSGVDGAVLITDQLRMLGFGCEVVVNAPGLSHVWSAEDSSGTRGAPVPIENYGTRHRAAFRFCHACESATAFIISQDGGVKAARRVGPEVVLWPEVNFGVFGI